MQDIEFRVRQTTNKVIWVNLISVVINIILSIAAFYFAFVEDSSATGAFAADCVLDFVSSAIVLWRYFGDLTNEYAHIREQIACLYLGALFELSAIAIIIKSIKDITGGDTGVPDLELGYFKQPSDGSTELLYLASVATLACLILTLFKLNLYRELQDNSILLDVINTLISSVFAISIVMSQLLISIDSSFWYLDPVLSLVLAVFMMLFGLKVLHQNIRVLKRHQHYEQIGANSEKNNAIDNNNNNNSHYTFNDSSKQSSLSIEYFDSSGGRRFATGIGRGVAPQESTKIKAAESSWQRAQYPQISIR